MFRRRNLVLVALLFVDAAMALGHVFAPLNDMRRNLPDSFEATRATFQRSFASGFGPGATETGYAIIHLSDTGADRIADGASPDSIPSPGVGLTRTGLLPLFRATNSGWPRGQCQGAFPATALSIEVPKEHLTAVNALLNAPGSFYAFGRGG